MKRFNLDRKTSFLAAAVLCSVALGAAPSAHGVTLNLTPSTPTINTFELELIAGIFTSSDDSVATGNIDVEFQHSFVGPDAVIDEIEFTGGQIDFADVSWTILLLQIDGTGVAGELDTPTPPSAVTNGQFDATEHLLNVNQGLFVSSATTVDISTMPFLAAGSGTGSVAINEISRDTLGVTYQTTVTVPIAFVGPVASDPFTINLNMNGTIEATGTWTALFPLPGDYDGNGIVEVNDYNLWAGDFGTTNPAADGNGNGIIDAGDYTIWRDNLPPAPALFQIPEPNGMILACLAIMLSLKRRAHELPVTWV